MIYLEDLGLAPALQMLARDAGQNGLAVEFLAEGEERRLSPATELALYRIAQEALSNIARHAGATRAAVALRFTPASTVLTVSDDGVGFAVPGDLSALAAAGHYGLVGMRERAQAAGARLEIVSAPGGGTRLTVEATGVADG